MNRYFGLFCLLNAVAYLPAAAVFVVSPYALAPGEQTLAIAAFGVFYPLQLMLFWRAFGRGLVQVKQVRGKVKRWPFWQFALSSGFVHVFLMSVYQFYPSIEHTRATGLITILLLMLNGPHFFFDIWIRFRRVQPA